MYPTIVSFREDAFQKEENTFNDIRFEEASILYNLAVVYSKLGSHETRKTHEVTQSRVDAERRRNILDVLEHEERLHLLSMCSRLFRKNSESILVVCGRFHR